MKLLIRRPVISSFDLCAGGLDQLSVIHARRTRGHTRHASETAVKVADPLIVHLGFAFGSEFYQVDSPARRIHFLPP
jgi:hypothetical protein